MKHSFNARTFSQKFNRLVHERVPWLRAGFFSFLQTYVLCVLKHYLARPQNHQSP